MANSIDRTLPSQLAKPEPLRPNHDSNKEASLSIVRGPDTPALWTQTLAELIDERGQGPNGERTAVVFSWQQHHTLSYRQLAERSKLLAKSMLEAGLKQGDHIGIIAGNCYQYIEVFLGAARIGCPLVVLNNTYSVSELCTALSVSACKLLFMASNIGRKSLSNHIQTVCSSSEQLLPQLKRVVLLQSPPSPSNAAFDKSVKEVMPYSTFVSNGHSVFINNATLRRAERRVKSSDVVNLQFTSGTTGSPKAAMLTHLNIINNARLFGDGLGLTAEDIVCCPPPLFHCFGLVLGFLAAFTHSSAIVFPCDQFDPLQVLDAVARENCTVILGVPTMFVAELEAYNSSSTGGTPTYRLDTLRLGLASGAPVPAPLMRELRRKLGIPKMVIAYGMTETSPVSFMTPMDDSDELRSTTVGRVQPHTAAKVVDPQGKVLPRGTPGELCVSGYALQKGYWQNEAKTREVMKIHPDDGLRWMHSGDECVITKDGYCMVTGRIKDLIIRGGENISPVEIEDRLLEHESIAEAAAVGIKDPKYGEVVGCFLRKEANARRLDAAEVNSWVRQRLGSHKAPRYVFWIGDPGVGSDYPKTGSGKHQKHILRALGDRLASQQGPEEPKAKL